MQKQSRQNDATWNFVRLVVSQLIPCIAEWCGLCAEMIWQPISYGGPLRSISSPISLIFFIMQLKNGRMPITCKADASVCTLEIKKSKGCSLTPRVY